MFTSIRCVCNEHEICHAIILNNVFLEVPPSTISIYYQSDLIKSSLSFVYCPIYYGASARLKTKILGV